LISKKEIRHFWFFYWLLIIRWGCVSAFFILSVLSIPFSIGVYLGGGLWWWYLTIYGLVVPFNFLLKYGFKVKNLWFFNDTKDGDFGADWWIKKYNYENKSKFTRFILWWKRNIVWNFIRQFKPYWKGGEAEDFRTIKSTVKDSEKYGRWTRADKENQGIKYIAYKIDGKVYCQWSFANKLIQIQLGGGSEYRFRIKL